MNNIDFVLQNLWHVAIYSKYGLSLKRKLLCDLPRSSCGTTTLEARVCQGAILED